MTDPQLSDADLKEFNDLRKAAADFDARIRSDNELLRQITVLSEPLGDMSDDQRGSYQLTLNTYTSNLMRAAQARGITSTTESFKGKLDDFVKSALQAQLIDAIAFNKTQLKGTYDKLFVGYPGVSIGAFPTEANKERLTMAGIQIGGGTSRQVVQVLVGSDGKVITVMNSGEVIDRGVRPELAKPANYQAQVRRDGALVAFDPSDPGKPHVVIDPNFGFQEVDPQIKRADQIAQFEANLAVSKQQVAAQYAGLELQRRGQLVQAQSEFMAREVEVGRMVYDEANTNLNRTVAAFDQRRKDQEILLQSAVQRTSLRVNAAGETVTALPLGADLAKLLGVAASNFDLPVIAVNPTQAAQQVAAASDFQSPIPGLQAQLEATRQAVAGIVGAPVASGMVAGTATQAAIQGVQNG